MTARITDEEFDALGVVPLTTDQPLRIGEHVRRIFAEAQRARTAEAELREVLADVQRALGQSDDDGGPSVDAAIRMIERALSPVRASAERMLDAHDETFRKLR